MTIIDLQTEREARTTPSQALAVAIKQIDTTIAQLGIEATVENSKAIAKLSLDKAALLVKQNRALAAEEREAKRSSITDLDIEAAEDAIKTDIRTFLENYDFSFVMSNNRFWLYFPGYWEGKNFVAARWIAVRKQDLNLYNVQLEARANNDYWRLFLDVMLEDGRKYRDMTHTFAECGPTTLNMMRSSFLPPEEGDAHWVFAAVIASLGGGKAENIDHIEKSIVAAYLQPEHNFLRPCMVFDDAGNTGKTLFATTVLATLFGPDLVLPSVDINDLNGFNGHLGGKAFVFINEVSQDPSHANILRRVLGSKHIKIEYKGVDAMFVDNTPVYWISGNNRGVGAVHFSNNGVDRRYSMLAPDRPLGHYLKPHLSGEDARDPDSWVRRIGQRILSDPAEVAKWIGSLIVKHGEVTDLAPLHGDDYRKILEGQKSTPEAVFERVFNCPTFTHIRRKTLFDFFRNEEPSSKMRRNTFYKLAEDWINKSGIHNIVTRSGVRWGQSSADVYVNASRPPAKIVENDSVYYTENEYGRVKWLLELAS